MINAERAAGLRRLFRYKLLHYPFRTLRLLRRLTRYMKLRDVAYLIVKPFRGNGRGPTTSEVVSRAVEHDAIKDAAAGLTQVSDAVFEQVAFELKACAPSPS